MTEKKKENKVGQVFESVSELLVQGLFGGIRSAVAGVVESAEDFVGNVTRRVAQGVIFTFCASVGVLYLLSGLEEWLNATYTFPGIGGLLIGLVFLVVALALYLISRNNSTR